MMDIELFEGVVGGTEECWVQQNTFFYFIRWPFAIKLDLIHAEPPFVGSTQLQTKYYVQSTC